MVNIAQLRRHASGSVLLAALARAGPWPPQCSLSLRCMCGGLPRHRTATQQEIRLQRGRIPSCLMSSKSRRPELPHTTTRTGARRRNCWLLMLCMTKREPSVGSRALVRSSRHGKAGRAPSPTPSHIRPRVASGDTAILDEIVWKGVHTGPLQTPTGTIPPSNKSIEMPACEGVRVEDGKIKSGPHYFDMLTMLLRSVPCRTLALLRERGGK